MNQVITVEDLEKMPQYKKDELSAWVLDLVRTVFAQPGAEEEYQEWLKEYRAKKADKTK